MKSDRLPKVSILMNCYNCKKYLKDAIDSVYAQTYDNWEIIFIDNCSTDGSKEIVKSYDKRIKYFYLPKTLELGKARNFGLSKCTGEYLAFLDTDDLWLPDKLQKQVNLMEANKEYKMCYGGVIYINENGKQIGKDIPRAKSGYIFDTLLKRYEINMQSVLIRKNFNIKFNEKKEYSPDFDLFMRIASTYQVCVIKDVIAKYRKVKNSLTSKKIDRWWIEMKETLDSIFLENKELNKTYKDVKQYGYAKVAYYKARYFMINGEKEKAIKILKKFRNVNIQYFLLYFLSLLPSRFWKLIHSKDVNIKYLSN